MNRIGKQWVPALGMLLWLPGSAGAHVGERLFPVSWLSDEMLAEVQLDGRIEEWYELHGEPAMTSLDFWVIGEEAPPDPATLDFRIWLAWHDDPARFYVAFVATDDVYQNTHDYSVRLRSWIGNHDSISLYIDGDHSGGDGCSSRNCSLEDWAEAQGQTQEYQAIARTVEGPTLDDSGTRVRTGEFAWTVLPPYGEAGGSVAGETPVISVIEFYVTPFDWWGNGWDSAADNMVTELAPGQVIGFAMVVDDPDPPEGHHDQKVLLPVGVEYRDIALAQGDGLLDGILLPVEPDVTAVEGSTWGRIKASLKVE